MIKYSKEVSAAKSQGRPIVALESTIISHGLPRPTNLKVAKEVEAIVREHGATPATIAIIDGEIYVGLEEDQLIRIANDDNIVKASTRDLAIVCANGQSAATTVAATSHIANLADIDVFATGGLGGVHRGHLYDESADLIELAKTKIIVVCAGVKSILDVAGTLERLETLAIPVLGYKTNNFPGFYLTDSGFKLEHRVESSDDIAKIWGLRHGLSTDDTAVIVANPVVNQMDKAFHDQILEAGLLAATAKSITGKGVTPFLLEHFHSTSNGESLRVNIEIIKSNSKLAAQIACAL
ncbi:MAG: pseudouridine-5'-phosphate glycosidase [Actinomycetes bacterium]